MRFIVILFALVPLAVSQFYKTICEVGNHQFLEGTLLQVPGKCKAYKCGRIYDYRRVTKLGCNIYRKKDPKCHWTKPEFKKPFPDCCPRIECPES